MAIFGSWVLVMTSSTCTERVVVRNELKQIKPCFDLELVCHSLQRGGPDQFQLGH